MAQQRSPALASALLILTLLAPPSAAPAADDVHELIADNTDAMPATR